jgi:uncharacterized membrane protein YhaH (DUF805 family)
MLEPRERSDAGALLRSAPEDDLAWLLFSFEGRLPRKSFWLYGVLGITLAQMFIYFLLGIAGVSEALASGVAALAVVWPGLAINVKRWHDRDKPGWWVLINLVPLVGTLWTLIECGLLPGTPGDNRFGPDPKGAAALGAVRNRPLS